MNLTLSSRGVRSLCVLFMLSILLVRVPLASAWIDTGHELMAMMVWHQLSPAVRAKLTEILKQHPRYKKDLLQAAPAGADQPALDQLAFMTAATWPDLVRSQSNPMHFAYNKPVWHYINIPYAVDGQPVPPLSNPTTPGPHDIVEALNKNIADLKSTTISQSDQAIAICWVLHLMGDIHQPLHCCQFYSKDFPNGDQGGNLMLVLREPPFPDSQANLHLVWDEMLGTFKSTAAISCLSTGIEQNPAYSRQTFTDLLQVTNPAIWAQESHDLAIHYAYLDGKLQVAVRSRKGAASPDTTIPGLPPDYLRSAEPVALKQIALAAYRTIDLLNSIYADAPAAPQPSPSLSR